MNHVLIVAAAIGLSAAPALAQGGIQTGAHAANRAVAAQAMAQQSSAAQTNADVQAQYQSDMAAYQQSLRDHHRAVRRNNRHYRHQQRAYADAMAAWRRQAYACHHGHTRACNAPTPDPADYY